MEQSVLVHKLKGFQNKQWYFHNLTAGDGLGLSLLCSEYWCLSSCLNLLSWKPRAHTRKQPVEQLQGSLVAVSQCLPRNPGDAFDLVAQVVQIQIGDVATLT